MLRPTRRSLQQRPQFVTLRFCFGMWWRRVALALNGMGDSGSEQGCPPIPTNPIAPTADPCNNAAWARFVQRF
jgi:hypothetical protein